MKRPSSSQPRKQRKWIAEAPMHRRRKMVSSPLSEELKAKYGRRRLTPRKGDTVEITRGQFKKASGEISRVDIKKGKIYVSGVIAKKADGTQVERPIHHSNVIIKALFTDDRERMNVLERKAKKEPAKAEAQATKKEPAKAAARGKKEAAEKEVHAKEK